MKTETFTLSVNLPSVEEFAKQYRNYGKYAKNEWSCLFEAIVTPESYNKARVATLVFRLPALAGVAAICEEATLKNGIEWQVKGEINKFIGAVVCKLMEDNGFSKTGIKKSVPHPKFTKGEVYQLTEKNNI